MTPPDIVPTVRRATSDEAAHASQIVASHRQLGVALVVPLAVLSVVMAAFAAAESLAVAAFMLAVGGGGSWWVWDHNRPTTFGLPTDRVVTLSGRVSESGAFSGGPFATHAIGGVPAALPKGWAAVGGGGTLDAEAVVVDLPGGARSEGYAVVSARRHSDGVTWSVADEVAAGGRRYHRPLAGGLAPTLWVMGGAFASASAVLRAFAVPGERSLAVPMAIVAGALLATAVATGVPYLRSRHRVEVFRDQRGALSATVHRERRLRWMGAGAGFAAAAFAIAAPFVGAPVWAGAVAGTLMIGPALWFLPVPTP